MDGSAPPLGIRDDIVLTPDQLRALRTLETFDLSPIRDRVLKYGVMPPGWIDEAIFEFRRYLGLHIVSPDPLPMLSKQVDDVWHACLLFSRLYAELCNQVFGRFFHHEADTDPTWAFGPGWETFERLYQTYYGEMGRLWHVGSVGRFQRP